MKPHPVVAAAAEGRLPNWAVVGPRRRAHLASVADLMGRWVDEAAPSPEAPVRWRAAGFLHDALKDEAPERLRPLVPPSLADLPPSVLHGPAAARRLREDGVEDEALLHAVAYHTLGHPDLDRMGCSLYAADFLEPGRRYLTPELASLRDRMPDEWEVVTTSVAALRIRRLLEDRSPLRSETVGFWNRRVAAVVAGEGVRGAARGGGGSDG